MYQEKTKKPDSSYRRLDVVKTKYKTKERKTHQHDIQECNRMGGEIACKLTENFTSSPSPSPALYCTLV